MIEHVVLVKFGKTTTQEQMLDVCQRFIDLKQMIPGMFEAQAGITSSIHNQGFQVLLSARFQDDASLEQYGPHPEHRAVASYIREVGRVGSIVMDIHI